MDVAGKAPYQTDEHFGLGFPILHAFPRTLVAEVTVGECVVSADVALG
jgi:hypothetical protein